MKAGKGHPVNFHKFIDIISSWFYFSKDISTMYRMYWVCCFCLIKGLQTSILNNLIHRDSI